jgi:hypothetical protein
MLQPEAQTGVVAIPVVHGRLRKLEIPGGSAPFFRDLAMRQFVLSAACLLLASATSAADPAVTIKLWPGTPPGEG